MNKKLLIGFLLAAGLVGYALNKAKEKKLEIKKPEIKKVKVEEPLPEPEPRREEVPAPPIEQPPVVQEEIPEGPELTKEELEKLPPELIEKVKTIEKERKQLKAKLNEEVKQKEFERKEIESKLDVKLKLEPTPTPPRPVKEVPPEYGRDNQHIKHEQEVRQQREAAIKEMQQSHFSNVSAFPKPTPPPIEKRVPKPPPVPR